MDHPTGMVGTTLLSGRYEIIDELESERGAQVYKARSTSSGRIVRVKVLSGGRIVDPDAAATCFAFVRGAAGLHDPNTLRIIEQGQTAAGEIVVVTDPPSGEPLRSLLDREGQLYLERAIRLAKEICASLREAHALGVVHGALCPASIWVTTASGGVDSVQVADYGIGPWLDPEQRVGTQHHGGIDAKDYDAPEMTDDLVGSPAEGEVAGNRTVRSDFYAVGTILFEMLAGKRIADNGASARSAHRTFAHSVWEVPGGGDVPPALDGLLARALARSPESRVPSAGVLIERLDETVRELASGADFVPLRKLSEYRRVIEMEAQASLNAAQAGYEGAGGKGGRRAALLRVLFTFLKVGLPSLAALAIFLWVDPLGLREGPPVDPAVVGEPRNELDPMTPRPTDAGPGHVGAPTDVTSPPCVPFSLRSNPPGAEVRRGGELLGTTPHELCGPEVGTVSELELSKEGFEVATVSIVFGAGRDREVALVARAPDEAVHVARPDETDVVEDVVDDDSDVRVGLAAGDVAPEVTAPPARERPRPAPEARERPRPAPEARERPPAQPKPPPRPPRPPRKVDLPVPDF